jgi:hypothetical protein
MFVKEGKGSWQQFFADTQVRELVTPDMAIFSAYNEEFQIPIVGKFVLVYRDGVDGQWRCTCTRFGLDKTCVHVPCAKHLCDEKQKALFESESQVMVIADAVLWVVEDHGVNFQVVCRRDDGTVSSLCVLLLISR